MDDETCDLPLVSPIASPPAHFRQQLSATRRGACLARLLAVEQLVEWGWLRGSDPMEAATLVVAELCSNAVTHGHVRGRDFLLAMLLTPLPENAAGILRIEVSDCRGEQLPAPVPKLSPSGDHGWGLLLVDTFASRWGVVPRCPAGKTVWAELFGPYEGDGT